MITCHLTGRVFEPSLVPRTPVRFVPGTRLPFDKDAVDFLYPEPGMGDPQRDAKLSVRNQALEDVAMYDKAARG